MSVILRSNRRARAHLGGMHGGWKSAAFFDRDEYFLNGEVVPMSSIISFARNSAAEYRDLAGRRRVVAVNVPRLDFDEKSGARGLRIEPSGNNRFARSDVPATQSVTTVTPSGSRVLVLYVEGSGSVMASGAVSDVQFAPIPTGRTFTATEGNPAYFYSAGAALTSNEVMLTVSGDVTFVQLEELANVINVGSRIHTAGLSQAQRVAETVTLSAEALNSIPAAGWTIALSFSGVDKLPAVLGAAGGFRPLIGVAMGPGSAGAVLGWTSAGALYMRSRVNIGSEVLKEFPLTSAERQTVIVSKSNSGIHFALNGQVRSFPAALAGVAVTGVEIGSYADWVSGRRAMGMAKSLAIFDRTFTPDEMAAASLRQI